jgi:4,5-DOPA dioxygenase extradiol
MVKDIKILQEWVDGTPATVRQPVLFIGHGSPMNAIESNPYTMALREIGARILERNRPIAAMVVSAHWLTRGTLVQKSAAPEIIYDFGGFPD